MKNIVDIIAKETKGYLSNYAVIDDQERISYASLFAAVDKASQELQRLGLKRFNRVALLCDDSIDYLIISLAVLKLYAVIVPIPLGSAISEVDNVLTKIKVNYIIFQKGSYNKKGAIKISRKSKLRRDISLCLVNKKDKLPEEYYKLNPAFIRFTSGTTGLSKGVLLSHESIIERTSAANKSLKITNQDQIIWVLSMSFHFIVTILLFLRRGATIILCSRKFPESLLEGLKSNKATFIYASPIHYSMMNSFSFFRRALLSRTRMAVSTAIRLPQDVADKFYKKFGFQLSQAYGIIEIGLPFVNTKVNVDKQGSVGSILPDYRCKIMDKDSNGVGKIYIKGKGMFNAYFSPWKSRSEVLDKGWFDTGDLGKLEKGRFLFIMGREKNIINFNGMKIFPFEVEAVLNQYPQIKESFVYGSDHAQFGQLPVAKVVLKNREALDLEDLRKFCYKRLVSYKVPKEFELVEKLPKTSSGKVKAFWS